MDNNEGDDKKYNDANIRRGATMNRVTRDMPMETFEACNHFKSEMRYVLEKTGMEDLARMARRASMQLAGRGRDTITIDATLMIRGPASSKPRSSRSLTVSLPNYACSCLTRSRSSLHKQDQVEEVSQDLKAAEESTYRQRERGSTVRQSGQGMD
jgi:hypothetical protein